MVDFEALGEVPRAKLRQAAPHTIRLRTAPAKADTLLPEDHHYQACMNPPWPLIDSSYLPSHASSEALQARSPCRLSGESVSLRR